MKISKKINNCLKNIQSVFNSTCVLCESSAKNNQLSICDDCYMGLPFSRSACPCCGLATIASNTCGHCLKSAPDFDSTHAVFNYAYPVDALLQQYKYAHDLALTRTLGTLLSSVVERKDRPDLIIPMPLHPQRLRERGFNQALEIARLVSKSLKLPMNASVCERVSFSPPQASLPLKQRVRNVRNAFACKQRLDGMKVAVLDDVMTTGATLNAIARALKKAGASSVECWVIARTQSRAIHV